MQVMEIGKTRRKYDKIVMKPGYVDSIRDMKVGDVKTFRGDWRVHGGLRNAGYVLKNKGKGVWTVELVGDDVKVTRIA